MNKATSWTIRHRRAVTTLIQVLNELNGLKVEWDATVGTDLTDADLANTPELAHLNKTKITASVTSADAVRTAMINGFHHTNLVRVTE